MPRQSSYSMAGPTPSGVVPSPGRRRITKNMWISKPVKRSFITIL